MLEFVCRVSNPLSDLFRVTLMSIDEIENAVTQLSAHEMARFSQWFDEFRAEQWDRQIEEDIRSGKLDESARQADDDFEAGNCSPL